jgi:hypothetical protein
MTDSPRATGRGRHENRAAPRVGADARGASRGGRGHASPAANSDVGHSKPFRSMGRPLICSPTNDVVSLSGCRVTARATGRPFHTKSAHIFGASFSEPTLRPNPRWRGPRCRGGSGWRWRRRCWARSCSCRPATGSARTPPDAASHIKRGGSYSPTCHFLTHSGLLHDRVRLDESFPMGPCSTSGDENSLSRCDNYA